MGSTRRIRSSSYNRVRRGSSYDLEKDDRQWPRSLINSPMRRRSPDPMNSSNDIEKDDQISDKVVSRKGLSNTRREELKTARFTGSLTSELATSAEDYDYDMDYGGQVL